MSRPANESRNARVMAYYVQGFSMRETAIRFGVSLERVRQILRRDYPHLIRVQHDTRNNSTGLSSGQQARSVRVIRIPL